MRLEVQGSSMKYDRKTYWEDHKTLFGEPLLKEDKIPEDLQFLQDFYDRWIAEQIKEVKKMGIRKASEGYEL